jgi:methylated-DNA-[protein]-cysteine S-methyltransferase
LTNYQIFLSPIGKIGIETDEHGVIQVDIGTNRLPDPVPSPMARRALEEMRRYFAGELKKFTIPYPIRGTAFKQSILKAMLEIPYGETASYGDLAKRIGNQKACRAVGTACATNDIPIIIPCHRVIKGDGSIGRFGDGPEAKVALINLEKKHK